MRKVGVRTTVGGQVKTCRGLGELARRSHVDELTAEQRKDDARLGEHAEKIVLGPSAWQHRCREDGKEDASLRRRKAGIN